MPRTAPEGRVLRAYRSVLRATLEHRRASGVVLLGLLAAGVLAFGFVPPGFMPDSARPQFVVDLYLPQGTDIDTTASVVAAAERKVRAHAGVSHVTSFIGQGGLRFMLTYSPEDPNPAYGQLLVDVDRFDDIAGLIERLQPELQQSFPTADVKVWKFMLGRGGGKKIEAAFRGPDPDVLRRLADEAKAIMASDPEALAIQDDWRQQVPVVRPRFSVEAAQRAGVLPSEIAGAIDRNFSGQQIGVYREREKLIPIIARAPLGEREGVEDLRNVQVYSQTAGRFVPVGQFVEKIDTRWENAIIRREDRFPMIKAQCDPPAGTLSAPLFERLRPKVEAIKLPPGYVLEWHGEHKAATEANEGLATAAPFGFAAMVLAVIVMFNALRQTAVIWLTVPLAVVGVAVGLLVFQAPFEFMAILGVLSLTGMLIKNAIVLVDQIDVEIRDGKPRYQAVQDAAVSRARPVFLGAATTVLGVAPLLVDPFFRSMAVTIMFGLIFATALTLVVVPLLYAAFFGIRTTEQGVRGMKPVWASLPALALVACQSAPFVAPEVPVPTNWAPQTQAAAASASTGAGSLADRPWAQVFPVPELTALIDEALADGSELIIAVERVELARAQYGLVRSTMFPWVNATGSALRQRTPGADPSSNVISESAALGLVMPVWEIDLWGKLAAQTEAARRDVLASAALAQGVRISLAAQVSTLYLELLDLDNQIAITRRTLDSRRQSLRMTRARFDEGSPRSSMCANPSRWSRPPSRRSRNSVVAWCRPRMHCPPWWVATRVRSRARSDSMRWPCRPTPRPVCRRSCCSGARISSPRKSPCGLPTPAWRQRERRSCRACR